MTGGPGTLSPLTSTEERTLTGVLARYLDFGARVGDDEAKLEALLNHMCLCAGVSRDDASDIDMEDDGDA